jgi:hypothetical protein
MIKSLGCTFFALSSLFHRNQNPMIFLILELLNITLLSDPILRAAIARRRHQCSASVASRLITWLQTVYVSFAAPSSQPRNVQLTPKSSTQLEITWEAPTLVDWNSEHLSYKVGYKYGRQTYRDVIKCKKSQSPAAAARVVPSSTGRTSDGRWVGWVSNITFLFHVQASWGNG